jgi:hypothetical protein
LTIEHQALADKIRLLHKPKRAPKLTGVGKPPNVLISFLGQFGVKSSIGVSLHPYDPDEELK